MIDERAQEAHIVNTSGIQRRVPLVEHTLWLYDEETIVIGQSWVTEGLAEVLGAGVELVDGLETLIVGLGARV